MDSYSVTQQLSMVHPLSFVPMKVLVFECAYNISKANMFSSSKKKIDMKFW